MDFCKRLSTRKQDYLRQSIVKRPDGDEVRAMSKQRDRTYLRERKLLIVDEE